MKITFNGEEIVDEEDCPVLCEVPYYRNYAMTCRKTRVRNAQPCKQDYINHLAKLTSKGLVFKNVQFEETNGLHIHGVAWMPEGFNIKTLRFRGWHLHLKEIYSDKGWERYILKEQETE